MVEKRTAPEVELRSLQLHDPTSALSSETAADHPSLVNRTPDEKYESFREEGDRAAA